ncbi:response regulator transcription factor [Caballeronia cordobensis]|uniref:response regulator transcription factor n=1 Tax=Caballeronia cordobensis TaxID=1353886 RepID=UPI00045EEC95|nr:two component transcriptional regulator, winged helix family [Burkholderia sp. RPE67]
MRVLLIENDLEAGRKLLSALRGADYGVDWVRDGESGRNAMASAYYAVVLLNPSVPRLGGIDFLKASRAAGNRIPVLLLTAHDDPGMRARALDTGADDCLLKPLDSREVLARIRAVLRRAAGYATSCIGDGVLNLDLDKRTIRHNGIESTLSAREFALMHAFLERRGSILSRGQLEERLYSWGREVESNAIDVLIHAMRKRFGRDLIRNVRGLGWTLTQHVPAGDERAIISG